MDDTTRIYRACFSTAEGRRVFGHILIDLGWFDEAETPEQVALRNYAKRLLDNLGLNQLDNVEYFVNKIIEMPITEKKEQANG